MAVELRASRFDGSPSSRGPQRWWRRHLVKACSLGAIGLASGLMLPQACGQVGSSGDSLAEPRAWLQRSHEAAAKRNYQGILVFTAGGAVASSRIAHFFDGQQQLERIEALDGEPRTLLRVNDQLHTVWPRAQLVVVEPRDSRASFPGLFTGQEKRLLDWYEFQLAGHDRMAGYEAEVVVLRARDTNRFSQRLWAEKQTGLLLRAEVISPQGQVLESAGFSELNIGGRPAPELVLAPLKKVESLRQVRPPLQATSLEAQGWQVNAPPPGFAEAGCVRRVLDSAHALGPVQATVHAVFSDGLTHVSVFIEPFSGARHQAESAAQTGATHTLAIRRENYWITLVGDVPGDTLKRFAAALERRR